MMRLQIVVVASAVAAISVSSVLAQSSMPARNQDCAAIDVELPKDVAAWNGTKRALAAAANPQDAKGARIALGERVTLTLSPNDKMKLVAPPEQVRTPQDPHAGIVTAEIPEAGTYRVSTNTKPWISVFADGKLVESSAHGQLVPCSTMLKAVEFRLPKGVATIQLTGVPGVTTDVMVTRSR